MTIIGKKMHLLWGKNASFVEKRKKIPYISLVLLWRREVMNGGEAFFLFWSTNEF